MLAGLPLLGNLPVATAGTTTTIVRDGSTAARAAASCWGIKQQNAASADGIYWLQTATLVAPKQFYCDMTTDGGGWVLVGRGRDGWTYTYNGQGGQAALRSTPTGAGAFAPATLPAGVVDGLLDGTRVDTLQDGIRLRRATNQNGTAWQEMRLIAQSRAKWTWAFSGGVHLSNVIVGGTSYGAGNTQLWSSNGDQNLLRLATTETKAHNYRAGFGYGSNIAGQNSATSYLWQYTTEKAALPFTQVFLRPRLLTSTYPSIPDAGLAATAQRPLMESRTSEATPWGVTGLMSSGNSELNLAVEEIAFIGNRAYVGGNFQYVQKGANPGANEKVEQPYLAAFDVDTGAWLPDFRPVLDGTVWDLQAMPDGNLAVGGEFLHVNGQAHTASLAEVNPTTGAPVPTWHTDVQWQSNDGLRAQVKGMDVQDGWLYIGGRFNRVGAGTDGSPLTTVGRAARVAVATGNPDGTWKPNFDGSVIDLDASALGDRVYFSGYFENANQTPSPKVAVVSTAAGAALVPGLGKWQPSLGSTANSSYQQAIREADGVVWVGGAEHILSPYARDNFSRITSNITRAGGDFQAIGVVDGVVYASCHCGDWTYSGTYNWSSPLGEATDVNRIRYIGAWDVRTGEYLPEFYPTSLDTRGGIGPWALDVDPRGCLWFGGDMTSGSYLGSSPQWLGGFGKYCPRDSVAPSAPTGLVATATSGTSVKLSWQPSTDDRGAVTYELLRNDRVVGTASSTTWTDVDASLPARYWVRAVDAAGNRSATTPVVQVAAPQ